MTIPNKYLTTNEGSIASYNYTDIAEGTGIVQFNGFQSVVNGETLYNLSQNSIGSAAVYTSFGSTGVQTVNFDMSAFNLPKTVRGTAYTRFSIGTNAPGNISGVTLTFQKISGGVTTSFGTKNSNGGVAAGAVTFTMHIPLTQTNFKKGDVLRLKVDVNVSSATGHITHDPLNRDWAGFVASTNQSRFDVYIPFRLDL